MKNDTYLKFIEPHKENHELLDRCYSEALKGRISYKLEREEILDEDGLEHYKNKLPDHVQYGFLNPLITLVCPLCGYPLSGYLGKSTFICLNCNYLDKKEKTFKVVPE